VIWAYSPAMSIDTTVLDTSMAVAPDLAWSLDGEDAVLDFPADRPEPDAEPALGERYSWWLVWRRAVLLVVVAAALAAGLVYAGNFVHLPARHDAAPAPAPPSWMAPTGDAVQDGSHDPIVCTYIRAGHTVQEAVEAGQDGGAIPLEFARAYVTAAIDAYCPEMSASATRH
jgi:hypothetical protein